MLNWFRRRRTTEELPEYSAIQETPTRGLPAGLAKKEASESFVARRAVVERSLREPPHRPRADGPLFVELLLADEEGLLTIRHEDGGQCLPVFSNPYRAADYIRTLLISGPPVKYLVLSPLEFVNNLRDLTSIGLGQVALDRCPRCDTYTVTDSASFRSADDAIDLWAIWKATEQARMDLYMDYAQASARAGKLDVARDVALEAVAHVSPEDPRPHLLLGQAAVALRDRGLIREAKSWLHSLKYDSWEKRLDQAIQSGSPDFASAG